MENLFKPVTTPLEKISRLENGRNLLEVTTKEETEFDNPEDEQFDATMADLKSKSFEGDVVAKLKHNCTSLTGQYINGFLSSSEENDR